MSYIWFSKVSILELEKTNCFKSTFVYSNIPVYMSYVYCVVLIECPILMEGNISYAWSCVQLFSPSIGDHIPLEVEWQSKAQVEDNLMC